MRCSTLRTLSIGCSTIAIVALGGCSSPSTPKASGQVGATTSPTTQGATSSSTPRSHSSSTDGTKSSGTHGATGSKTQDAKGPRTPGSTNSGTHGSTSTGTHATTSTTTRGATGSGTGTPTTSDTTGTLLPQSSTVTEFFTPGGINCEIDDNFGDPGQTPLTSTLCLTTGTPRSVVLDAEGKLRECSGAQCLANAGVGTPTLQYGDSIALGPFTCVSLITGVQCELTNGDGFVMSDSGAVTPVGGAVVDH